MDYKRRLRVEELVKVSLSNIIQRDISGRLPGLATIMRVDMSDDGKYAKVFVSIYGSDEAKKKSLNILKKELKNIRKQLGSAVNLRNNPKLSIVVDKSLDNAFRINELLDQINSDEIDPDHEKE